MAAQVILTTFLLIVPFVACLTDCVVNDIPVQDNVDMEKVCTCYHQCCSLNETNRALGHLCAHIG